MNVHEKIMTVGKPGDIWVEDYRYPGYFVEPTGRVLSARGTSARILTPIRRGKYLGFTLPDRSGKLRPVYLHRLVAENFYGPCPDGMECCHNDGNRFNNALGNLRWDTHAANEADKIVRNVPHKLTEDQVRGMRDMRTNTGASYAKIAKSFGVTAMTAFRAITRQAWAGVN